MDDLDKSVREMASEGKLDIDFDPSEAPPKEFDVKRAGDALCVGLPKQRKTTLGAAIMLIIPAAFIYLGFFFIEDGGNIFGLIGAVFFALLLGWLVWTIISRCMVRLYPGKIHIFHRTRWGDTKGKVFTAEEIEDVRVGAVSERHGSRAVIIATEDKKEALGTGLAEDKLEWLRNCILAVIAGE